MTISCVFCGKNSYIKKGRDILKNGVIKQRCKCKSCGKHFYTFNATNIKCNIYKSQNKSNTWVITTALNNTPTNKPFFNSLLAYCAHNDADLLIIPVVYNPAKLQLEKIEWDAALQPYFFDSNVYLLDSLRLMAGTSITPTAAKPLSGWDAGTKGKSLIIPSPQITMKTVAKDHINCPSIMYTTGCVSEYSYLSTKAGEKAIFNHSYAALVVEEDKDIDDFHIRVLNADDDGSFFDIDKKYDGNTITSNNRIPAIVVGDEHIKFIDPLVKAATFENSDSIVNVLNPEVIVRHDVLDFYSASHHHDKDKFLQFQKFLTGDNDVEEELKLTVEYLINTTPSNSVSYLVESNHNKHLTQWLNKAESKQDFTNLIIYHELSALKLRAIKNNVDKDAFELWAERNYDTSNLKFLATNETYKIAGIEIGLHGDNGTNGSRGSAAQFAKLGQKTIVGHSHSPGIEEGSYVVGHSCKRNMGYNKGPSSWNHAHCLIQPNGKRQMIFIKEGKWKR